MGINETNRKTNILQEQAERLKRTGRLTEHWEHFKAVWAGFWARHEGRIKPILSGALFPAMILYFELVLRIACREEFWSRGLIYVLVFSIGSGLLLNLLCSFRNEQVNRRISLCLTLFLTLLFIVHAVYYTVFKTYLTISITAVAGEAMSSFWIEVVIGIWKTLPTILLMLIPIALLFFKGKGLERFIHTRRRVVAALGSGLLLSAIAIVSILLSNTGVLPLRSIYRESFVMDLAVPDFGLVTSTRLDLRYTLFGRPEVKVELPPEEEYLAEALPPYALETERVQVTEQPPDYPDNVLDIDFDALMARETDETLLDMHTHFSTLPPTQQNEYTGLFAGKNLIWLVGEAFSSLAVDETLTPTLYKLAGEGFVFSNFYNPDTGFSTTGGEFLTLTSLLPADITAFLKTADNEMPFGFGTMFSKLGYTARAYHNHTYTYYGREKTHPNLGYEYKGVGNGLEMTPTWPESDLEMMALSVPDYINDEAFHVYYMTVSGHMNYSFVGNQMSAKHQEAVEGLPYTDAGKAYIACNMELDLALEYLIEQLDQAGILEDTVIALSGDHYPYGLESEDIEGILGHEMEDPAFDIYHSTLILWNAGMAEPVQVNKYCSSLDVMPTLANLFGLDYDSRLIMGTDILSNADPLVIFANNSWISQVGKYNARTDTFTLHPGARAGEEYAQSIMSIVYAKVNYSKKIVDKDYYSIVLPDDRQGEASD